MPFKNACFFSYRHRPDRDYQICLDDLYEQLAGEISLWLTSEGVFRDKKRLQGGDFLEPSIARDLCESACMVMVYIPPYFDERAAYCAREFRAMQRLETLRLQQLGARSGSHSLIIPIVCRGWSEFPKQIREERLAYNFEPYLMQKRRISQHREGAAEVKQIARYIFERFKELQASPVDPCQDCPKFILPATNEIIAWVREVQTYKPLLPGRTS